MLVRLGAKFEDWMISDLSDILEEIRNNFCKSLRGENFMRLCRPKNSKGMGINKFYC